MNLPGTTTPVIAREVLWTYSGVSEDSHEQDFFAALAEQVAAEIALRFKPGERIRVGREIRFRLGGYIIHARLTNIEPLLATHTNSTTQFFARYRTRARDEGQDVSAFFAETIRHPNENMEALYKSLVGLDEVKEDLARKLNLLLKPRYLTEWIESKYKEKVPQILTQTLRDRYPLFILEGEVGSGKTALARSIGSHLANHLQTEIVLFVMNAQVRGGGHVGELTQNISRAFNEAERCLEREQLPVVILIDEADSLAQSRGGNQTHHEDDAGVNTLIQRIDRLRGRPMAVLFATNLVQSLDSAVLRRASATYHFDRPSAEQRAEVFRHILTGTGIEEQAIAECVLLTEPRRLSRNSTTMHRYTYSDLSQRIIPRAVEDAIYTRSSLRTEHLINACNTTNPTPEVRIDNRNIALSEPLTHREFQRKRFLKRN